MLTREKKKNKCVTNEKVYTTIFTMGWMPIVLRNWKGLILTFHKPV